MSYDRLQLIRQEEAEFKKGHHRRGSEATFKELTRKDALEALGKEVQRLLQTAAPAQREQLVKEMDAFQNLFSRFLQETGPSIHWEKIEKLPHDAMKDYKDLKTNIPDDKIKSILDKLVVVKLNGGLGTTMGCDGPKSLISVRNELTFLDLNVQQIENLNKLHGCSIPLVLMDSFNTEEDTEKVLRKYRQFKVPIHTFNQSMFPRVNRESLLPIAKTMSDVSRNLDCWYPPGHGDIYESFYNSGLLDKFIEDGKEWVFISNIDNLGATVDLDILKSLTDPEEGKAPEFVMEVTNKTRADQKGGTLIWYDGKLRLLEIAQVPKEHVDEFKSIRKFKIFNTNNLWINLNAMKRVVEEKTLHMEIIINPKTLDNGLNVIQLETAVGAAIKSFDGAIGIVVPRKRFLPVKKTSDLLIVMSNLYNIKSGALEMNQQRSIDLVPLVKLGTQFNRVRDFLNRFASIPDVLELDHLTVSGDVNFGRGVILRGTVIIIANNGERIDIPPGAILENKIISGNLRILDH
ncbi:UTP--glucose-1-phosphate uridylyltransferase-like isoform X2 [Lineus longissimus]|uniref:UTP--glucose-1-phosphate uridylyltransferase-like isoform X2 n=1 Tax=Lineus longissimus TaxID=88925 RepID=UPI002B4E8307